MHRDGQAALEYLMNYAWAISLVLIVAVALFSLGITDLGTSVAGRGSGATDQFQTLGVVDQRLYSCDPPSDCDIDLTLRNNGAERLNITRLQVTQLAETATTTLDIGSCNPGGTIPNGTGNEDGDLHPGEQMTCTGITVDASGAGARQPGDPYRFRLRLTYDVLEFGGDTVLTKQAEATLRGETEEQ